MDDQGGSWRHHPVQLRLVDGIARVTWRDVAANDLEPCVEGPVVLVANHFGGAADAIVLMSLLPRRPRILADDTIWRYPVARQVMNWLGAIPVHRGRSAKGGAPKAGEDNTDMFSACHDALADGDAVLIFPEGITREEPSIGRVRSGAARIALGARAAGVEGIRIVPVGIHYDDKAAFRSSVYVRQGEPIDLDRLEADASAAGEVQDAHEVVDALTDVIEERLRLSAPDYDDWREARSLQTAAEAFLRSLAPDRSVPIGLRDRLGGWLSRRPDHGVLETEAGAYRDALSHSGVTDSWALEGETGLRWRSLITLAAWLLMLPYAVIGVVVHAVPMALSWLVTRLRIAPAVMATVMPIASGLLFGIAMGFWAWIGWRVDRWAGAAAFLILFPITFSALVLVAERAHLWWRGLRNRLFSLRRGRGATMHARRDRVVGIVADQVLDDLEGRPEVAAR